MFEDIKGLNRRCKSTKDRQYNGEKRMTGQTDLQNPLKPEVNPCSCEGKQCLSH